MSADERPEPTHEERVQYEARGIAVTLEPPYDDLAKNAMDPEGTGCAICDAFRWLAENVRDEAQRAKYVWPDS